MIWICLAELFFNKYYRDFVLLDFNCVFHQASIDLQNIYSGFSSFAFFKNNSQNFPARCSVRITFEPLCCKLIFDNTESISNNCVEMLQHFPAVSQNVFAFRGVFLPWSSHWLAIKKKKKKPLLYKINWNNYHTSSL